MLASGGTITRYKGRIIHTFTTDGTFTLLDGGGLVSVLVVGAGGAGRGNGAAGNSGSGGNGGSITYNASYLVTTSQSVTIGIGGTGVANANGNPGGNTVFGSITSNGGAGGNFTSSAQSPNGGDGAGGAGQVAGGDGSVGGYGGPGVAYDISGSSVFYAGGGAGGFTTGGAGGSGVGGNGETYGGAAGSAGAANSGSGGGGRSGASATAGYAGANGIVIVSYQANQYIGEGWPQAGLVAGYHFNGNSTDFSGNNNHGTDTAITYSQANGKFNQGAGFNGTSSVITFAAKIIPQGAKTVSFWLKSSSTAHEFVLTQLENGNVQSGTLFALNEEDATGKIKFVIANATTANQLLLCTSAKSVNDGVWHQIVGTWDGTTAANAGKIYVDGALEGVGTASGAEVNTPSNNLKIGNLATFYLTAAIDEFQVYNVAKDAAWVRKQYAWSRGKFL